MEAHELGQEKKAPCDQSHSVQWPSIYQAWRALDMLHNSFNLAQNWHINPDLLDEISNKEVTRWPPFLKVEIIDAINKCNNSSTLGLDKLSWRYFKKIIKNEECINKLINIANTCIDLGH